MTVKGRCLPKTGKARDQGSPSLLMEDWEGLQGRQEGKKPRTSRTPWSLSALTLCVEGARACVTERKLLRLPLRKAGKEPGRWKEEESLLSLRGCQMLSKVDSPPASPPTPTIRELQLLSAEGAKAARRNSTSALTVVLKLVVSGLTERLSIAFSSSSVQGWFRFHLWYCFEGYSLLTTNQILPPGGGRFLYLRQLKD